MASILVVDDAETTRKFFHGTLGESHDLVLCENWEETRASFEEFTFDLVYLDCWLPDREGTKVLESIREFYEGPVVLISGYADQSIIEEAQSLGIQKYLEKPFEPDTIRETTRTILQGESQDAPVLNSEDGGLPEDLNFYDNLKILVVDDEESTRGLLSHPLETYGLSFQLAENPESAWSIYQEMSPNVVILDAKFPDSTMSASELLRKIRSEEDDTFVIGITGYPESEEFESFDQDELAEFYYKPFPIKKLLRTLSYLSFVINRREHSETPQPEADTEDFDESSSIHRKVLIGLVAILVGLTLGFMIKWTQELAESSTSDNPTIEKMFNRIEGYLERDERRERRE